MRGASHQPADHCSSGLNSNACHVCSYCRKVYSTAQALGGHQTAHRKEMQKMRELYEAPVQENGVLGGREKAAMDVQESSVNLELSLGNGGCGLDLSLRL